MGATLTELLENLAGDVPGCQHTSVIDGRTGLSLAAVSETDPLDSAGTDAFHSDLYRLSQSLMDGTSLAGGAEEIVLNSGDATFISIPVDDTGFLWLVVTDRETTVGFVQALMRKHVGAIEESLRDLV